MTDKSRDVTLHEFTPDMDNPQYCEHCGQYEEHPRHGKISAAPTPTEQAAMDARPGEPDASGDKPPHPPHPLTYEWDRRAEHGDMSEIVEHGDKMANALDAQAAEIAAYERLDEEGYASLAVDLAAAEQRIANLEYANSDTAGEQQLRIFAKQNAALREALDDCITMMTHARVFVTTRERIKAPEGEQLYDEAISKARAALEASNE